MLPAFHQIKGRIKSLFHKRRMDREMLEELEFHQSLLREKLLGAGISPLQVESSLRRSFGNADRWHERLRELWQFRWLENLRRDISFSARLLRKSPGFTLIALITLALGVGANTAVFSLVNGLLLRPLPVPHNEQLVVLGMETGGPKLQYSLPAPFFRSLESKHDIFSSAFAYAGRDKLLVRSKSGNENISGMLVSGDFFKALETPPLMGRHLTPEDDRPGGSPSGLAVVITEDFWLTWFNHDPDVVGRKLQIANTPFTVVGVMPKRFVGADATQRPKFYLPLAAEPIIDAPENLIEAGTHAWWITVIGRLRPGVTLPMANAALAPISMPIAHESVTDPTQLTNMEKRHFRFVAEPGARGFNAARMFFSRPLMALFAMCGGILLLACMNLASLLMARSAARERELATRLAMGATQRRLVQQMLVESLLIACIGTAIGLTLAPIVSHAVATMLLSGVGRDVYLDTSIDYRVLGFSALVAVVSSVLIGLVPALMATSGNLSDQIKDGQHTTQMHERRRILPKVLMTSEVGLALLLIVSSGLLATSLFRLYRSNIGFDALGVVNLELAMDKQPLEGDALARLHQKLGDALNHQQGVQSVSFARIVPLTHTVWDDDHMRPGGTAHDLYLNAVAPDYFKTMHIAMLEGRDIRWNDTTTTGLKIILNQSAARLFFPDQDPLGQHILRHKMDFEIIGVVADTKYEDLRSPSPAAAYTPITQFAESKRSWVAVVRFNGPLAPLAQAARNVTAQLAPQIPAPVMTSMESVLDGSISTERVMAMLSLFFAGCALLVTAIGLYGTLSYNTARRTSEIGIRMALGARRTGVVALVFRENATIAVAGTLAGLGAAVFASKLLASFLYETSPRDPWILVISVATLMTIASAASLMPAIRAARIEPITAIRCE